MDEILLTRMQMKPLFHKARKLFKEAVARDEEIPEDEAAFVNEYICQAQVARVCSDFLEPWLARIEESIRHNPTEWLAGERSALRETIRNLRAAAGACEGDVRAKILHEVQQYVNTHDVYQVVFEHYDEQGRWIPLQTRRINIEEALK